MIIDLPTTTTSAIDQRMIELRENGSAIALGRVLTLVIVTDETLAEDSIQASKDASREHPCRVLVVVRGSRRGSARLDAQIRVGGEAGASEVVVLRTFGELVEHAESVIVPLLLPDAPLVAWWPGALPKEPGRDPIGRMAQRRITDSATATRPRGALERLAAVYTDGDTDLAWSRITHWRALIAATLDQPPFETVTRAEVTAAGNSPSGDLLAGWLAVALRCPVTRVRAPAGTGVHGVRLHRESGPIVLVRSPGGSVAQLQQPGQPDRRVSLPPRSTPECLTEELRRLDADERYAEVLIHGLPLVGAGRAGVGRSRTPSRAPTQAPTRPTEEEA